MWKKSVCLGGLLSSYPGLSTEVWLITVCSMPKQETGAGRAGLKAGTGERNFLLSTLVS